MEVYYFLFGIGVLWTLFAVVQDMKTTEIANWISYSLIIIGLAFRGFYSLANGDPRFFLIGLLGLGGFFVVSMILYYCQAIAGGDVKLLTAYGVLLPFFSFWDVLCSGLSFLLILLLAGLLWTLIYSVFIVFKNKNRFVKEFRRLAFDYRYLYVCVVALALFCFFFFEGIEGFILGGCLLVFFSVFVYVKALDKCMIVLRKPGELIEGDWLIDDVEVGGKKIEKNVHGLSAKEIKLLKKFKRSVYIKTGIQFTPPFLVALIFMGYVCLVLQVPLYQLFLP